MFFYYFNSDHIICEPCKEQFIQCGECGGNFTNIRIVSNEQIISSSEFKCEWHEFGCKEISIGEQMTNHVLKCNFR